MSKNKDEEPKQGRIEFKFPMLTVRTQAFLKLYDRLGSYRASRPLAWVALIIMPIVAGFGIFLISTSLINLLTMPEVREVARELGPQAYLLLPGINPYLPIFFGWMGIVVAIAVHEGAHGVIARSLGLRVKSSGLLFILAIPIGAFVDVDEEEIDKAKARDSVRVLAAGHGANIAIALICISAVTVITAGLNPVIDGLYVADVLEDMPAEKAGLSVGDVIIGLDDKPVTLLNDFTATLKSKNPGDTVYVTVARGEKWKERISIPVGTIEREGRAFLGVSLGEMLIEQRLETYRTLATKTPFIHFVPPTLASNMVPFSEALNAFYTHALGEQWHILANIFFWLWFVNVNLAIFNALPIYPLDGGQAFKFFLRNVLGHRFGEKAVTRITVAVTVAMAGMIALMIVFPYI